MEDRFEMFTVLIAKISRSIRRIKTEEMSEYNLKSPHVSCLYYIYKRGALAAAELCELCAEDKASISRSIEYLESNGYIVCESNQKKRYNSPLSLTQQGQAIAANLSKKIDDILALASAGISDTKRNTMYHCLQIISKNLDVFCNNYESKEKK